MVPGEGGVNVAGQCYDSSVQLLLVAPAAYRTGKMVVESKADMKKRGLRSPDLADAFLLI